MCTVSHASQASSPRGASAALARWRAAARWSPSSPCRSSGRARVLPDDGASDRLRHRARLLHRDRAHAGQRLAVGCIQARGVADHEHARAARHAQVRLDHHPSDSCRAARAAFGERFGVHARRPENDRARDLVVAQVERYRARLPSPSRRCGPPLRARATAPMALSGGHRGTWAGCAGRPRSGDLRVRRVDAPEVAREHELATAPPARRRARRPSVRRR